MAPGAKRAVPNGCRGEVCDSAEGGLQHSAHQTVSEGIFSSLSNALQKILKHVFSNAKIDRIELTGTVDAKTGVQHYYPANSQ